MAKSKKPARKAPKAAKPAAEPVTVTPGRKFATVRNVTLPVLALKIETPAYVTFRDETPRKISDDCRLARVVDLDTNAAADLEVPTKLQKIFEANYPEGPAGKSFCIVRHAAHARKNEYGYTVEEIDPTKPTETGGA